MVKTRLLLVISVFLFFSIFLANVATTQRTYYIEREWVKIWINQNGTIDLFYNISLSLDSGDEINYVYVGQPNGDFTIGSAMDQYGHNLTANDASSGNDYRVKVNLYTSLKAGETIWFSLMTNVARMIYEDTQNPNNVGMQFVPTWWEEAEVLDLRTSIVLPAEVPEDMVKTRDRTYWNYTSYKGDRLEVYWEKQNLQPNEQFPVGVSFPKEYIERYYKQPSSLAAFLERYGVLVFAFALFASILGASTYMARRKSYKKPRVGIETLGIRRGLTAVEASYLLDLQPTRIVTEILYSLLKKKAIWVESADPSLKLRVMPTFQNRTGNSEAPLRYYEIDFLQAIDEDGTLDEEKLAETVLGLRDTVEQKLHGYCRRDTINYYRDIIAKAWDQVEQAGTPGLASKAYDKQLLWLFLDPTYQSRTEKTFQDRTFEPSPFWLWYWYSYRHYHPNPKYEPNVQNPSRSAKPPAIPGSEFADNIATALENTSNNIVANLEKFAKAVVPVSTAKASAEPARHGASCVCACAACACACACVSCACACASGGVG